MCVLPTTCILYKVSYALTLQFLPYLTLLVLFNPCMVFGSVGPFFTFYQKKKDTINYFFKLILIGLGSFSVKNIYQNKCSMPTHIVNTYYIQDVPVHWTRG